MCTENLHSVGKWRNKTDLVIKFYSNDVCAKHWDIEKYGERQHWLSFGRVTLILKMVKEYPWLQFVNANLFKECVILASNYIFWLMRAQFYKEIVRQWLLYMVFVLNMLLRTKMGEYNNSVNIRVIIFWRQLNYFV